jgi:hypothetical protein
MATPTPTSSPTATPESELIIDQIKKSVVFIQGEYLARPEMQSINGSQQLVQVPRNILGTGFLIGLQDERLGKDGVFYFLVTNQHMIREPGADGTLGQGPYFNEIIVRLNLKSPNTNGNQFGIMRAVVVDQQGTLQWFTDSDDGVDLAITPIGLDFKTVDAIVIASEIFATRDVIKKEHLNEMDELLFAGLFARNPGAKKNYPIVRHGKLARLSAEPIPVDPLHPGKSVEVHLADVMSFGGNSGSPVFIRASGIREGSTIATTGFRYYLIGVMQGYFPESMDVAVNVALAKGVAAENSGIAAVIPADKIVSILNTSRAEAYRERVLGNYALRDGKLDEAEAYFKKAISLLESSAPLTTDLAAALDSYAALLRKKKQDKEAVALEDHAQKIKSNVQADRMLPRK